MSKHIPGIIVQEIGAKLISNREQNMLCIKSQQILCSKRIFLLTALKVSYLACKCIFYRPEHNVKRNFMKLNFAGLEMQN